MIPSSQVQIEEFPIWSIVVDIFLTSLSLSWYSIMLDHWEPSRRGYFCNDDSLRYPYKSSTVNDGHLYGFIAFGMGIVTALELWLVWCDEERRRRVVLVAGRVVPEWTVRLLRYLLLFGYGIGCQDVLANVMKFTAGRLRPHFLAVCQPNVVCNASDPSVYIQDYECTSQNEFAMVQTRLSFPSGHASLTSYIAVFVAFYLERRIRWPERAVVTKTAIQLLAMMMAWFTALSRIQDYKHHSGDVIVGCLLGAWVAMFWVRQVLRVSPDEAQSSGASETTFVFAEAPAVKQ